MIQQTQAPQKPRRRRKLQIETLPLPAICSIVMLPKLPALSRSRLSCASTTLVLLRMAATLRPVLLSAQAPEVAKGTGWNLARDVAEAQLGNYVAGASVKKGVITLTSRGISVNGKDSFSLILVPKLIKPKNEYESPISWELDPASTCLSAGLCDESFMKRW